MNNGSADISCVGCGNDFPEHLFYRVSWSFHPHEQLCPVCNRARRNFHLGLDPDTPFPDEESNRMYEEAVTILRAQHPLDLLNDN